MKQKKEEYKLAVVNKISKSKDSKTFWNLIKSCKLKSNNVDVIELNEWYNYFRDFFIKRNGTLSSFLIIQEHNPSLDYIITIDEVVESLNKCKNGKATGQDVIGFEFFKNSPY